jgi:hypothetical protein
MGTGNGLAPLFMITHEISFPTLLYVSSPHP